MDYLYNSEVEINTEAAMLTGTLTIPSPANGIVIFSHGSGSSRLSPRNRIVAQYLHTKNLGTLLFDLLTMQEDERFSNRFDIGLLTARLTATTQWLQQMPVAQQYPIGFFGASTGAASALAAAAALPQIAAVVSRGGRPDLAITALEKVKAPTLLIVGSLDYDVLQLNKLAYAQLRCEKKLEIVEKASHLFEEPGAMEQVCEKAWLWFARHFRMPAEK